MRKYASRTLRIISLVYCATPVLYPIWLAVWFDIPGSRVISLFLSPVYWLTVAGGSLAGWGLWEMKRWSWYVFMAVNLFLTYQTAFVAATFGESHHSALAFLVGMSLLFAMMIRVGAELRVPYFLPNIRWWESDPARKILIPTRFSAHDKAFEGDILDLSMQGCFLKTPDDFTDDEKVQLKFQLFGHDLDCPGFVVWRAESTVTHPKGIGVKFDVMPKPNRRRLRIAVRRLRESEIYNPFIAHKLDPAIADSRAEKTADKPSEKRALTHAKS